MNPGLSQYNFDVRFMQNISERLQVTRLRTPEDPNINIGRRRNLTYPRRIVL